MPLTSFLALSLLKPSVEDNKSVIHYYRISSSMTKQRQPVNFPSFPQRIDKVTEQGIHGEICYTLVYQSSSYKSYQNTYGKLLNMLHDRFTLKLDVMHAVTHGQKAIIKRNTKTFNGCFQVKVEYMRRNFNIAYRKDFIQSFGNA